MRCSWEFPALWCHLISGEAKITMALARKKPIQIEGCNEFVPIKTIAETNATIPSSPQS
jgi:hypothetical protein